MICVRARIHDGSTKKLRQSAIQPAAVLESLPDTEFYLMHIPSYQIRNVLNIYRKHLCKESDEKHGAGFADLHGRTDRKTAPGRRQTIIKMVGADVFDRINRFCARPGEDGKTDLQVQTASEKPAGLKHGREKQFFFNVINENNEKSRHSLCVEDIGFFLKGPGMGRDG